MGTDKLKPCPFCGGEAKLIRHDQMSDGCDVGGYVGCTKCHVGKCLTVEEQRRVLKGVGYHGGFYSKETRDELDRALVEMWNRRAERTCRPEVADDGCGAWGVYCPECGHTLSGPHASRERAEKFAARRDIMPLYCPECGTRVVGK